MNLDELHSVMQDLAERINGARVEVGRTDRPRHNDVFIKLIALTDPETFAIISTSGGGAFELTINGGFSAGMADDQAEIEDVRKYLESYVRAASAYWSIRKSRMLQVPILTIQKGASRLNLAPPRHWSTNDSRLAF